MTSNSPTPGRLAAAGSWLLSLATLAGLAIVGWYGHHTHWTFGFAGDHGEAHEAGHAASASKHASAAVEEATKAARAAASESRITFASVEDVKRSGITCVPVERRSMIDEVIVNGVVRYDERKVAQLSVRAPGIVWRVDKRLGDPVKRGDVLVVIDSADVGRLKAEFLTALVVFESKTESLAILEEIKGAVLGRQIREARAALREARNDLMNAEQALINLGFEISIKEFQQLDDDARAEKMRTLGLPRSLLAGVDAERLSSNLLPLVAPFDGVVIGRDVVVGEIADPSSSIFEVADLSTMWIVLNVGKEDAARIKIGQKILFRPDGGDRDFESHVTWISTELDETTRTLQVRAEIAVGAKTSSQDLSVLRANAFGRGRIEISRRSIGTVVPLESVQSLGGEWVVFIPKDETTFELRTVAKGLEAAGAVEVLGDLAGATHVVGPGSHVLKSRVLLERMEAGRL